MADKLVAVRIKQQDGTYSNEIPIGTLAENVAYSNTKNLLEVLGTVDLNKGDIQTQLDALFLNIASIGENIAAVVDQWIEDNQPEWQTNVPLDSTLTSSDRPPVSNAVPKLIAVNESPIQGTKMTFDTTNSEALNILTDEDVDDTLSISGTPADAKATGDAVSNLKESLNSGLLIHISWEQGRINTSGIPASATYAIRSKDFITVGEVRAIKVMFGDVPLPTGATNISCSVYEYSSISPVALNKLTTIRPNETGEGIIPDTETLTLDNSTVAIKFALNFKTAGRFDITPDKGNYIAIYWANLPFYKTTETLNSLKTNAEIYRVLNTTDLNDANEQGYYNLSASTDYANLPLSDGTTGESLIGAAKTLEVFLTVEAGYLIQRLSIATGTYNGNVYVRRRTGTYANPTWRDWVKVSSIKDFNDFVTEIENVLPPITDNNIIEQSAFVGRNSLGENKGTHIKLLSYNVRGYKTDTTPVSYISADKIINIEKLLFNKQPDILTLQEDQKYIDLDQTMETGNHIYNPMIPISASGTSSAVGPNIRSKINFTERKMLTITVNGANRTFRYGLIDVDGKKILIISFHATAGETAEIITLRAAQYTTLFQWINGDISLNDSGGNPTSVPVHTHIIIGMDANSKTATDKENLLATIATYNCYALNGWIFGWMATHYSDNAAIDNIVVSNNIIVNNFEVLSGWYNNLFSDHIPLFADLTLI